ncbi:alpha-N-arabinofuranosidase [Candidatus Omnitrophus magneticus]|uniref:Alpha-N-arabinofuranosidase n=1 Tax=Candidatus Omnitrophus magneticus TaxID=1609969 RepID=A0A0F0CPD3_9BACT|nr:alpha-N-arabinofuranosidase [Candidatus Omnitrophus magneticus]
MRNMKYRRAVKKYCNIVVSFLAVFSLWYLNAVASPVTYLDFDGSNDYVNCGTDSSLDLGTGNFTITTWIKTDITDDGEHMILSAMGLSPMYMEVYQRRINMSFGSTWFESSVNIADGAWHHVAAVVDRSSGITLYIDGVAEAGGSADNSDLQFTSDFYIGRYSSGGYYFDGGIADVQIFNQALTSGDINNIYGGTSVATGLVANWKLEEGAGNIAIDNTGVNNGVIAGPIWKGGVNVQSLTADTPNVSLKFDGDNDCVNLGTDSTLDPGTGDFSISIWIKTSITDNGEHMIYSAHGANPVYLEVYQQKINMSVGNVWYQHTANIADGDWHHIVGVIDRDLGIKIYVDGAMEGGGTSETSDLTFTSNAYFGRYSGNGYYFDGELAKARIYNRVLDNTDVSNIYSGTEVSNGLIGKWQMDDSSGSIVQDSNGTNNGTIIGSVWTGGTPNTPTVSLDFDGVNDYVDFGTPATLDPGTSDFSISLWVKTSISDSGEHMIFSAHGTTTVYMEVYQQKINFSVGGTYYEHSANIADGSWHHVVAVMNRDEGITIYVDKTAENGGSSETTDLQFTSDIYLGKYSGGGYYFDGEIADVKIYNKELSGVDVSSLYEGTTISTGLIGNWTGSPSTGISLYDQTSSNNKGAIHGAGWVGSVTSNDPSISLLFDGNDYVDLGTDSSLDPGTGDFSISAWVKTTMNDNGEYMIYSAQGSDVVYLEVYQGKIGFSVGSSYYQHGANIADGEWHHVVAVMDRDIGMKVYVDRLGETGGSENTTDLQFTSNIYLGKYSGGGYYFDGEIGDVSVYNRALTSQDAIDLYGGTSVTSGLISRWNNTPGTGSTIDDINGTNDGTINGAKWVDISTITRKEPEVYLSFNGNDYVDFGTDTSLDPGTNDFTISTWVKTSNSGSGEYMIYSAHGTETVYLEMYQGKIGFSVGSSYYQHSVNIADGAWHHVVAVMDRDAGMKVYVDESLETGGSANTTDIQFTSNTYLGKYSGGNYYWDGEIGDTSVYSRALTKLDVKYLYGGLNVTNDLVSKWAGLPGNGSSLDDEKGTNNGTIQGAAWVGSVTPKEPNASLIFDGNDYVDLGTNTSLDPGTGDFSISVWVKTSVSDNGEYMIYSAHGAEAVYLEVYQQKIGFSVGNSYYQHSVNIADGEWHHVVAIMDRDSGMKVIVDGNAEMGGSADTSDLQFTSNVYLGRYSGGNYYFNGDLSDVSVYNRMITNADVLNLYAGNSVSSGLVANWIGTVTGSTLEDTVGNNDGTIHGATFAQDTEYYSDTALLKRKYESSNSDIYEYLNENWIALGYGRNTLVYNPAYGVYKTYDWGATTVTVTEYTGVYNPVAGSDGRSAVKTSELTMLLRMIIVLK